MKVVGVSGITGRCLQSGQKLADAVVIATPDDRQDPGHLSSSIDVSMESHLMGFAAERSRRSGKKEKIKTT